MVSTDYNDDGMAVYTNRHRLYQLLQKLLRLINVPGITERVVNLIFHILLDSQHFEIIDIPFL